MYQLSDIQACEPEVLLAATVASPITVTIDTERDDTSAGCARVTITAHTKQQIIDFVKEQWGTDDTDWFYDYIECRIEEVAIPVPGHREAEFVEAVQLFGPGVFAVTETPDDPSLNPCWVGIAANAVDALDRYARSQGFAGYTGTEMEAEVGIFADPMPGFPGVAGEDGGVYAVFTNTTIYAIPILGVDEGHDWEIRSIVEREAEENAPADRTILVHLNLTVSSGADPWPSEDIVQLIDGALQVGLEGAPHPKADAILNIAVTGEEI
jgi:hypothetical protein